MLKSAVVIFLLAFSPVLFAQQSYKLPFASTGNAIELTVANSSTVTAPQVKVEAVNIPSWLRFAATEHSLQSLHANEESTALFTFSVDKLAPVNQEHRLQFQISTSDGQSWTKEIPIVIAAPETFELFQNYPNPFNPVTTISYQLPANAHVVLRVYNLLGQEVATLVDAEKPAGYHREIFDARNLASGMYIYQLTAISDRARTISRRAMALVK